MGRPKTTGRASKGAHQVLLRLSGDEHKQAAKHAKAEGLTVATFIREVLLRSMQIREGRTRRAKESE